MHRDRCPLGSKCPAEQFIHELAQGVIARGNGRVPDRETFWLIERKVSPPMYITTGDDLTQDPLRARRFTSERAAHDHWRLLRCWRDECFVTEHMFINRVPEIQT